MKIITTETTRKTADALGHIARANHRPVGSEALVAIDKHIAENQAALKKGAKMPKVSQT